MRICDWKRSPVLLLAAAAAVAEPTPVVSHGPCATMTALPAVWCSAVLAAAAPTHCVADWLAR